MDSASESIRASGWRQGSLVEHDDVEPLLDAAIDHVLNREKLGDETRLIVISQDCDLVRDSEIEPYVELLLCKQVSKLNRLYQNGRNPRVLQILVSDSSGAAKTYEFSVHDRFRVMKESLQPMIPDEATQIEDKYRRLLCGWVAKRYDRPAFPDAFNLRLASVEGRLGRLFKSKKSRAITGIFIAGAGEEHDSSEPYDICVLATAETEEWDDPEDRGLLEKFEEDLSDILGGCEEVGISLYDIRVMPEEDLTLKQLRHFKRLDKDYRSLPEEVRIAPTH